METKVSKTTGNTRYHPISSYSRRREISSYVEQTLHSFSLIFSTFLLD